MPDDAHLDDRLRRMAAAAIHNEAALVDVDAGAAELRRRLDGGSATVLIERRRRPRRRWALGAAAAALVAVGGGALVAFRGTDGGDAPIGPPTTAPLPPVTISSTPSPPSSVASTQPATASPDTVRAGEVMTITPSAMVTRACTDIVTATTRGGAPHSVWQLVGAAWRPTGNTATTVPGCVGTTSADAIAVVIPPGLAPGSYDMCVGDPATAAGCASVSVSESTDSELTCATPFAPPSLVDGSAPGPITRRGTSSDGSATWGAVRDRSSVSQLFGPTDHSWLDDAVAAGRAAVGGTYQATVVSVGDGPIAGMTIYLRDMTDGCVRTYSVGPGLYQNEAMELARRWVAAFAAGGVVAPRDLPLVGVEYYGRRFGDDMAGFAIDRFGADGSIESTLTAAEVGALFPTAALADGSTLSLTGAATQGRCENRPVEASGGSAAAAAAVLPEAQSLLVTGGGLVVASRDVCDDARWGDPGTRWELVTVDTSAPDPAPQVVLQRASDPAAIQSGSAATVIADGKMFAAAPSPDDRFVSVRDAFQSDQSKWHVVDLQQPGQVVPLASSCPIAGDIVGAPHFVGDGTVVVARLCATTATPDALALQPIGEGDVRVEAVDLRAGDQSGGVVVWSASRSGVQADGFTRTVAFDATIGPDGQVWAIVGGNGDFEESPESFVFHGSETTDITRIGFQTFAFDASSLISPWDQPPSG